MAKLQGLWLELALSYTNRGDSDQAGYRHCMVRVFAVCMDQFPGRSESDRLASHFVGLDLISWTWFEFSRICSDLWK